MEPLIAFLQSIIGLIDQVLVPLVIAVAFLMFIWGVYLYFFAGAGNEEKRKEGRSFMVYAVVGFFIMFSLWGIVQILTRTFGFNAAPRPELPYESTRGGSPTGGPGERRGDSWGGTTDAPGQQGGILEEDRQFGRCSSGNLCAPWNECIGGECRPRSGFGGAGETCVQGRCVNGYMCSANQCIRADEGGAPLLVPNP